MKLKLNTKEIYDILNSDQPNQNERQLAIQYLINKIEHGKELNSVESHHLMIHLKLLTNTEVLDYFTEKLPQYSIRDHEFRTLFPNYWDNLLGGERVYTPFDEIPIEGKIIHLDFLHSIFLEWKKDIENKNNNKDKILNLVREEVQLEINKLKNDPYFISLGGNAKLYREKRIYLYSKFVYILTKDFVELNKNGKMNTLFNDRELWLDYVGFCHILFRHYGGGIRLYETKKSFHTHTIHHKNLGQEIIDILYEIGKLGIHDYHISKYIPIEYKETKYGIWIKESKHSIKDRGIVEVLHVKTFYPIENEENLFKLIQGYEKVIVSNDLIYYKKIFEQ